MTLVDTVTYLLKETLPLPPQVVSFEEERCKRDTNYKNNAYVTKLVALRKHKDEILDALLDATPKKPHSFRSGIIPLIKRGGLFREYACNAFEAYVTPIVAYTWYPHNHQQFVRDVFRAIRESPYNTAIKAINTWGKAATRNPLWNISERIIHNYTAELHIAYMDEIKRICKF